MTDLVELISRAIAPKAWATDGSPPGHDPPSNLHRRIASLRHARAALDAIEGAGFAVVPIQPTEVMVAAVRDPRAANGSPLSKGFHDTWRAALAAAPSTNQ